MVHFGLERSVLVHLDPPTILWRLAIPEKRGCGGFPKRWFEFRWAMQILCPVATSSLPLEPSCGLWWNVNRCLQNHAMGLAGLPTSKTVSLLIAFNRLEKNRERAEYCFESIVSEERTH